MKLLPLVILMFLAGCNETLKPLQLNIQKAERPDSVTVQSLEFHVLDADKNKFVCLDPSGYERLMSNLVKVLGYQKKQGNVIKYYEDLVDDLNTMGK